MLPIGGGSPAPGRPGTARGMIQRSPQHQGHLVTGPGHSAPGTAVRVAAAAALRGAADRGRRRTVRGRPIGAAVRDAGAGRSGAAARPGSAAIRVTGPTPSGRGTAAPPRPARSAFPDARLPRACLPRRPSSPRPLSRRPPSPAPVFPAPAFPAPAFPGARLPRARLPRACLPRARLSPASGAGRSGRASLMAAKLRHPLDNQAAACASGLILLHPYTLKTLPVTGDLRGAATQPHASERGSWPVKRRACGRRHPTARPGPGPPDRNEGATSRSARRPAVPVQARRRSRSPARGCGAWP